MFLDQQKLLLKKTSDPDEVSSCKENAVGVILSHGATLNNTSGGQILTPDQEGSIHSPHYKYRSRDTSLFRVAVKSHKSESSDK